MQSARKVVWLVAMLLSACASAPVAPVRIDGSTTEAFRASWARMKALLSDEQEAKLNTAVFLIGANKTHDSGFTTQGFSLETLRPELDGKTFDDIIAAGKATGATITVVEHGSR